jgi:hypothetical protein
MPGIRGHRGLTDHLSGQPDPFLGYEVLRPSSEVRHGMPMRCRLGLLRLIEPSIEAFSQTVRQPALSGVESQFSILRHCRVSRRLCILGAHFFNPRADFEREPGLGTECECPPQLYPAHW